LELFDITLFISLHLVLPVKHTLLSLHNLLHLGVFLILDVLDALLLFTISVPSEFLEFVLRRLHLLLEILPQSIVFVSLRKKSLEHDQFLLGLSVLEQLLLLIFSFNPNLLDLFIQTGFFVREFKLNVMLSLCLFFIQTFESRSEFFFAQQTLGFLLS